MHRLTGPPIHTGLSGTCQAADRCLVCWPPWKLPRALLLPRDFTSAPDVFNFGFLPCRWACHGHGGHTAAASLEPSIWAADSSASRMGLLCCAHSSAMRKAAQQTGITCSSASCMHLPLKGIWGGDLHYLHTRTGCRPYTAPTVHRPHLLISNSSAATSLVLLCGFWPVGSPLPQRQVQACAFSPGLCDVLPACM